LQKHSKARESIKSLYSMTYLLTECIAYNLKVLFTFLSFL